MEAQIIDIRLAQFQRVTKQIAEAKRARENDKIDFLLAQADVLFAALRKEVAR